jgi:hypothetical protein
MDVATVFSSQELGGGTTAYSNYITSKNLIPDYAAIQLTVSATGALTVTQQLSLDGANWQDPTDATSAVVSGGTILQGVYRGALTGWIPFTPLLAPYTRLKLAATSTIATVQVKLITSGDIK